MTEAYATLIAALITAFGTVSAVAIGVSSFRGRVKDVESALTAIENSMISHQTNMGNLMSELAEQATTTLQRLNAVKQELDEREPEPVVEVEGHGQPFRQQLLEQWHRVRDKIEALAADAEIDGRTRAMYARRDRRSYWALIEEMDERGHLRGGIAPYNEALELWMRFKNNRVVPNLDDIARMTNLADRVADF
jgi:hypothetical protein